MYTLRVCSHFDAAHFIADYPGKCKRMHGHRWDVEVAIGAEHLGGMNMVYDFSEVKTTLDTLLARLDHYVVNEILGVQNVTAELIAQWLYKSLAPTLQGLKSVRVWESPDCSVEYSE